MQVRGVLLQAQFCQRPRQAHRGEGARGRWACDMSQVQGVRAHRQARRALRRVRDDGAQGQLQLGYGGVEGDDGGGGQRPLQDGGQLGPIRRGRTGRLFSGVAKLLLK